MKAPRVRLTLLGMLLTMSISVVGVWATCYECVSNITDGLERWACSTPYSGSTACFLGPGQSSCSVLAVCCNCGGIQRNKPPYIATSERMREVGVFLDPSSFERGSGALSADEALQAGDEAGGICQ